MQIIRKYSHHVLSKDEHQKYKKLEMNVDGCSMLTIFATALVFGYAKFKADKDWWSRRLLFFNIGLLGV
jgi:hypothetical protein